MEKEDNKKEDYSFNKEVEVYIDHIDSLQQTSPMVNMILKVTQVTSDVKRLEFIKDKGIFTKDENGEEVTEIAIQNINKFLDLDKKASNSKIAERIIQRNFIVSLVSQFDAFLGSVIRKIFLIKPELLNNSEKNLTFSKLMDFKNIDEAKEYIIEKEIESVLRDSHSNQFKWLENKLGMTLTTDLESWKDFVEITERRNLFVHSNGVISSQYLTVCLRNNVNFEKAVQLGDILEVDDIYFLRAYSCLYEIGVKLSQVIWRKLLPDKLENADSSLTSIIYKLIQRKEYKLAIVLSEFATNTLKKHSSQEIKLIFNVNKAQAYKWNNQEDVCKKMMNGMDWSAMSDKFKLSKAVLLDDFPNVYKLMRKIGVDEDEMPQVSYQEWPLFQKIREEDEFKITYKEIFKVDFECIVYDDENLFKFEKTVSDKSIKIVKDTIDY